MRMREAMHRLTPEEFRTIAQALSEQLEGRFGTHPWAFQRREFVEGSNNVIAYHFDDAQGLLFKISYGHHGVYLQLHKGEHPHSVLVARWHIHEDLSVEANLEICSVQHLAVPGRPEDSSLPLRFDHPITRVRPGYDPAPPDLVGDVIGAIEYQRH